MCSIKLATSVQMLFSGAPLDSGGLPLRCCLCVVQRYTLQQHSRDVTPENVGHWLMSATGGLVVMVMGPDWSGLDSQPRIP